ncbi:hypothetical protein NPIL_679201 [Nephila pilipes]|uniref:Uncharacterized protein n=1 Tax=Nephila pilipes TaxID=299642 RepID=A0A8X6TJH6_NEPPI|nr:hypothetical protein NPIL_679201 [Nephila pilipes]
MNSIHSPLYLHRHYAPSHYPSIMRIFTIPVRIFLSDQERHLLDWSFLCIYSSVERRNEMESWGLVGGGVLLDGFVVWSTIRPEGPNWLAADHSGRIGSIERTAISDVTARGL